MVDKDAPRYLIQTSGNGMFPAGKTVGHIEGDNPQQAEENLIAKGGIPVRYRGFLNFVLERTSNSALPTSSGPVVEVVKP